MFCPLTRSAARGCDRYVGPEGAIVGMRTFGASAPIEQLPSKFGFTPEKVSEAARELVRGTIA